MSDLSLFFLGFVLLKFCLRSPSLSLDHKDILPHFPLLSIRTWAMTKCHITYYNCFVLNLKEMQIEMYHFTPIRLTEILKSDNCGKWKLPYTAGKSIR